MAELESVNLLSSWVFKYKVKFRTELVREPSLSSYSSEGFLMCFSMISVVTTKQSFSTPWGAYTCAPASLYGDCKTLTQIYLVY